MNDFLKRAVELSRRSVKNGGYPVGSVVIFENKIVGVGLSDGKNLFDATSHAEIAAIRAASTKLGKRDLFDCVLYTSMEPCLMCLSACYWAKIRKVVYAIEKDAVSDHNYEGHHDLHKINAEYHRPIEMIHVKELETEAISIVMAWEKNRGK